MSQPENQQTDSTYDLIVFGATSFVGQLLADYLANYLAAAQQPVRWAIAGRSQSKLEVVKQSLGQAGQDLALVVADATDAVQMQQLCEQTRVVVSTVGPYALYGEQLVKACAESGTDYCDLTGEVQWIRAMLDRYESSARATGARIVNCCGFDSIPSDLGVHFLQQQAIADFGEPAVNVKMRVRKLKGGVSGGTAASLVNVMKEGAKDRATRNILNDPFALCPVRHGFTAKQHRVSKAEYDADFDSWIAPFMMALINEAVVRRSNALSKTAHNMAFTYDEAMTTGPGTRGWLRGWTLGLGMGALMGGIALSPTRALIERFVLPKPGAGPSPEQQQAGHYDLRFFGQTAAGQTVRVKVAGEGDPGYASTCKMLGQAALCLVLNDTAADNADGKGGFWTPASLFGSVLVERLTQHANIQFDRL